MSVSYEDEEGAARAEHFRKFRRVVKERHVFAYVRR